MSLDFAKKKNWEISSLSIEVAISLPSLFSWDEKKHSSFKFLLTQAGLTERSTSWGIRMRSTEWIKRHTAPTCWKYLHTCFSNNQLFSPKFYGNVWGHILVYFSSQLLVTTTTLTVTPCNLMCSHACYSTATNSIWTTQLVLFQF